MYYTKSLAQEMHMQITIVQAQFSFHVLGQINIYEKHGTAFWQEYRNTWHMYGVGLSLILF
jgi:hypothetical protein